MKQLIINLDAVKNRNVNLIGELRRFLNKTNIGCFTNIKETDGLTVTLKKLSDKHELKLTGVKHIMVDVNNVSYLVRFNTGEIEIYHKNEYYIDEVTGGILK